MNNYLFGLTVFLFLSFIPQKKTRIIFFGDSITELGARPGGFITRIDSLCKKDGKSDQYEFIGAGISSDKVYDLYLRLEDDVISKNPDVVLIFIGVNDVWHKTTSGTGTDPKKFERFYEEIIDKLKGKNIKTILCTPAVIGEKTDFSNPQDGDMNEYSNIIKRIATKNSLQLVDLRKAFLEYNLKNNSENKDRGILTTDRVHLNAAGNQLVAEKMWETIRSD